MNETSAEKFATEQQAPVPPTQQPEPLMQYFTYKHLPINLQNVSRPFCELAADIITTLPRNPERTVALRKLLESKDCAVRAALTN